MFHLHIATEEGYGDNEAFAEQVHALGFEPDNLLERGLTFDEETGQYFSSCPLIAVHSSAYAQDKSQLEPLQEEVVRIGRQTGVVGYWHTEVELVYAKLNTSIPSFRPVPAPFDQFRPKPREAFKRWDFHASFQELPEGLKELLIRQGFYFLRRTNYEGKDSSVFTMQSISAPVEGHRFMERLVYWFMRMGVGSCGLMLEATLGMGTFGNPSLIPPTIESVIFW